MLCGISGVVPQEPVVCVPSGRVYERRLAEAHISLTGTEPTTGAPVTVDDLLALHGACPARARGAALRWRR
jgi:pre-mRNA-processing factor 19